jgi:Planctomycete cytochrome C
MAMRFMRKGRLAFVGVLVGGLAVVGTTALMPVRQACAQSGQMSYKDDIVPIFKGWCISCHQPGGQGYKASGVDLTSYAGLMKGTKFGTVVIPKDPDSSTLVALIYGRTSPQIRMPYGHKPLPNCLRTNIWQWIFEGAKDN